jgi:hypothetical protein
LLLASCTFLCIIFQRSTLKETERSIVTLKVECHTKDLRFVQIFFSYLSHNLTWS